ncbi:unnamed protein product [Chondrus crispus]|uniref:RZ-type domain-containing protein n=1 Tax=Chondrus crispus TaxID=2769 RepID=R7QII7_CHOCR|nr:unnamed protein product [Chondrus crispus]CDF38332.1 unnamed protein product [Chondrus crispus]|eukprot:XP_005718217.1 unnamed protein product [Chondrus crispus]
MSLTPLLCYNLLLCGHFCPQPSHSSRPCPPCLLPCLQSCPHRTCRNPCSSPCPPCYYPCSSHCLHFGPCPFFCAAPCAASFCNSRCQQILPCGHRCPSLCGHPCPPVEYCQTCALPKHQNTIVDITTLVPYGAHEFLDQNPILLLQCSHFFTVTSIDGLFQVSRGLEHSNIYPPSCPTCRQPIRDLPRYLPLQKVNDLRLLERKHQLDMMHKCTELVKKAEELEAIFKGSLMCGVVGLFCRKQRAVVVRARAAYSRTFLDLRAIFNKATSGPMITVNNSLPSVAKLTWAEQRTHVYRTPTLLHIARSCLPFVREVSITDLAYSLMRDVLLEAIRLTDEDSSYRSGAVARLLLVGGFLHETRPVGRNWVYWWEAEAEALQCCDWVINATSAGVVGYLKSEARRLKGAIDKRERMHVQVAATRGPQANGVWHRCFRGHQYLVSGCGNATEAGLCLECGLRIGRRFGRR